LWFSKQVLELIDGQSGLSDDRPQRSFGNLTMIWYSQPSVWWALVAKDYVTAALTIELISDLLQCLD